MKRISLKMRAIGLLIALALMLVFTIEPLGVQAESTETETESVDTEAETLSKSSSSASVKVTFKDKTRTYYNALKKVYLNDKAVSLAKYPIFKKSGSFMGPAEIIFGKGKLGTVYDATSSRVAIRSKNTLIVMRNGKKTAYLNGSKVYVGTPAMLVNYKKSGKTMWVVPLKSVCRVLGLKYSSADGKIKISKKVKAKKTGKKKKATKTKAVKKVTTAKKEASKTIPNAEKILLCLDAGHGGGDSGAGHYGFKEKNMNLAIVLAAKRYFDQDPHFKVYYTRVSDVLPSLNARCTFANSKDVDFFISVHINSYKKTSAGTETLYNATRVNKTAKKGLTSLELAAWMQGCTAATTGFGNRGLVNRPKLIVLKKTKMPACLIEYGFLSNPKEARRMNQNLNLYGKSLYNGVVRLMKRKGRYK